MAKKFLLGICFLAFSCATLKYEKYPSQEFRGVWVATVVNIDWPKNGKEPLDKQKEDFLRILNFYDELNFNALIVQIRTAGDAFYKTDKAPWSRYLTGKEGHIRKGQENILQWMLDRTHERGIQFHAWFNPYRATFDLDTTRLDKQHHDFYKHRDWMVKYGKKYYYNPGNPQVWKHLTQVIGEVVTTYNIDGVHFDDYFYPYKVQGEHFNDSNEYEKYAKEGQPLGDWRRANMDSLIKNVHEAIKIQKPWVQFGLSPFGVWKNNSTDPKGSDTKAGLTTYDDLYADPLLWMKKGWIDYIVPQAYWSMEYPPASHRKIAEWWSSQSQNTPLFMGNGLYKIRNNADEAWNDVKEIPKQLAMARNMDKIKGNVFFSARSLMNNNDDVLEILKKKFYKRPALPLVSKNEKNTLKAPIISSISKENDQLKLCISHFNSNPRYIHVYGLKNRSKSTKPTLLQQGYISPKTSESCIALESLGKFKNKYLGIVVSDGFGNQSDLLTVDLKQK